MNVADTQPNIQRKGTYSIRLFPFLINATNNQPPAPPQSYKVSFSVSVLLAVEQSITFLNWSVEALPPLIEPPP